IPGPVEFLMGSPVTEKGRKLERQHKRWIGRSFALAAKAVTVPEFRRFLKEAGPITGGDWYTWRASRSDSQASPDEAGAIIGVDWYTAAAYCNWLSMMEGIPEEQWCYETNIGPLPVLGARTVGLMGSLRGQGPFLAASALFPGRTNIQGQVTAL